MRIRLPFVAAAALASSLAAQGAKLTPAQSDRADAIHATCEDYRASATIDLVHDRKDFRKKLQMPVLALWGKHGVIEALFNCLADWREVAADVRGRTLPCGHFIPEEKPRELLAELRRFLAQAAASR